MRTTYKSIINIDGLKKVKPGVSITFNGDDRISKFANLNGKFRQKLKRLYENIVKLNQRFE